MSAGKSDVEQAREWSERLTSAHTQRRRRARAGMWLTDLQVPALAALLTRMADALATREADVALLGRAEKLLDGNIERGWNDARKALLADLAAQRER